MTKEDLKSMPVANLRSLARECKSIAPAIWSATTGTDIANMGKEMLVDRIDCHQQAGKPLPASPVVPVIPAHNPSPLANSLHGVPTGESMDPSAESLARSTVAPAPAPSGNASDPAVALQALLASLQAQAPAIDPAQIQQMVQDEVRRQVPVKHEFHGIQSSPVATSSRQHYLFPLVMALVQARIPVMLVGPAGCGKSTLVHEVAKTLSLPFSGISFGPQTSKADLLGMKDAHGTYHPSALVNTAVNGGIFLGDEMDAAHPGVLTSINMLLANGHVSTPDGLKEKSPDFSFLAGVNTFGSGADRQYVGRNQLDSATLDRFFTIYTEYDEGLEASLIGESLPSPAFNMQEGGLVKPMIWHEYCRLARQAITRLKLRHIVSPRAVIYGAKLAPVVGRKWLEDCLVFKGLDAGQRAKLEAEIKKG